MILALVAIGVGAVITTQAGLNASLGKVLNFSRTAHSLDALSPALPTH